MYNTWEKNIYKSAGWSYQKAILLAAPFSDKAKKMIEGRKHWRDQLKKIVEDNSLRSWIWVHAASLGEFEQGRPVIEALKKQAPDHAILLTFFSPSGYEVRKNYDQVDGVMYLPFDGEENARDFFDILQPSLGILIKYEFWKHYIETFSINKKPLISISAVFREDQLFFKNYGSIYKKLLSQLDHIFVQNLSSEELVKSHGIQRVSLSGDTRFDRVAQLSKKPKEIPLVKKFVSKQKCLVLGSLWPSDWNLIKDPLLKHKNKLKCIIAPHNIIEKEIQNLEEEIGEGSIRYSQTHANDPELAKKSVLIIDNIGLLSSLYAYGDLAYIGGALRGALHNCLEAAAFGILVVFGKHPNNRKFQEAMALRDIGAAREIASSKDWDELFSTWLQDPKSLKAAGKQGKEFVLQNLGAADKIVSYCLKKLYGKE